MAVHLRSTLLPLLLWLLPHALPTTAQVTTVSITVNYPHTCVRRCLSSPGVYEDMGSIMKCATPYANDCYCATLAPSASRAASWVSQCVSSRCAEGDLSMDLSAMGSVYASYCMGAGLTQPGATNWFNPQAVTTPASPGRTDPPSAPATTTELTVVTETSRSGAVNPTLITVKTTSTMRVGPSGEPLPSSSSGSNFALGLGLGLGIPAALAIIGTSIWFCIRAAKKPEVPGTKPAYHDVPPVGQHLSTSELEYKQAAASATKLVTRKPVPAPALSNQTPPPAPGRQELTGQLIYRELGGTQLYPFPDHTPSPPVALPGQHELGSQGMVQELYSGHEGRFPSGVYQQQGQYLQYPELGDQRR